MERRASPPGRQKLVKDVDVFPPTSKKPGGPRLRSSWFSSASPNCGCPILARFSAQEWVPRQHGTKFPIRAKLSSFLWAEPSAE
jgi:hypothetical protein